jgi:hypothetical protein
MKRLTASTTALAFCFAGALTAQQPRPQAPGAQPRRSSTGTAQTTTTPEELGTVRGVVVNTSGQPVRRALVSLRRTQQQERGPNMAGDQFRRQTAETDEGGNFSLTPSRLANTASQW